MWIPNKLLAKRIEAIRLDFDSSNVDEYNRPIPIKTVLKHFAEVIPYNNTHNRELMGITNSLAYRVNLQPNSNVDGDDIISIDGNAFKIVRNDNFNIIRNTPLQLIVEYTGQTVDEYIQQKAV